MTQIEIIKALSDNYIYILHNPINKQTAVIDPGDAQPVIELLDACQPPTPSPSDVHT